MTRVLLTGNGAAAWGARLAEVDYVPAFPITPQSEIIERVSEWTDAGELDARMVTLESEHSMITAAGAAAATGIRVFSATSSQGLLYAMEMLYTVAGWRAPFVLVNVSRGLASPITLESDHNDIMSARDCGFLQIHAATCQEVVDSILMAYRLGEDPQVRLPVIVNLDGFYLSFTREPVQLPDLTKVRQFLPPFDPENNLFRASAPQSLAMAVLGGGPYSYFRYQLHLAAQQALQRYDAIASEFTSTFGRNYDAVEAYRVDDAQTLFVMLGSFSTKAKEAVDRLREQNIPIGLVRPRLLRPFPREHLRRVMQNKHAAAVIDQNLSTGMGGVLHSEIASALYGMDNAPLLASFIGGLGGRDITQEEFYEIAMCLEKAIKKAQTPEPRLLYTENELRELRKLQAIALVENNELEDTP
jgi:pyruvate ferredoxin oxidoreductase alpha subunit